ncbi:SusC/RagA family TonB-linked outer membrane protein [Pedobacter psychrophilus]|uniref:SusC/RagA family TonB-linked outer membrane protein n=1 Tax=Pedobacter psychrophilus TaxID=1826909 RepID=A0A179DNU2_9SPHI|nr:SusC/RagA family TonB-linked outer membrane protein [Pedobacter psychrophilus]OAQ42400.1 SusC/RagA family TonB-linked outer membrane protein [Pedobacter psychrophilus]
MKLKYYYKGIFLISILLTGFSLISQAQKNETRDSIFKRDSLLKADGMKLPFSLSQKKEVNIAFGTLPSNLVTSSISTVSGDEIKQNFNTNLGSSLYGRLTGLTVSQPNSEPGAATAGFTMRGRNTFGDGDNSPLIIIDGFIGGGSGLGSVFSQLLPEEIETITLLKDASATAIYGARGANGVLLVTTKKGGYNSLKVDFSTRQGFQYAANLPQFLNAGDYATLFNEGLQNDGQPVRYSQADIDAYRSGSDPIFHPNVNWYDEVLRDVVPVSSYNLNFNGGDSTVRYFVMLNALGNQGLYKNFGDDFEESSNSTYNRYNFRSNVDINLSKNLSASFKLAGSLEQKDNPFGYTTEGQFNLLASLPPNAFPVRNPNGTYGGSNIFANPVANLESTGFYSSNSRTLQTALRLTQKLDFITKGLNVSGVVSINNYFIAGTQKTKGYGRFAITGKDAVSGNPTYAPIIGQTTTLSAAEITRDQYRNYEIQGSLNYDRKFGKHYLNGLAMISTDNSILSRLSGDVGSGTDPYKHNSLAGRLTYAYNQTYIAEFSAGYMGSERFAEDRRYGFFPAGSLGWVISNESFLSKNSNINFLKLRASYGLTGNDNIYLGSSNGRYPFFQNYNFDGSEGVLANPFFTWEKENTLNLGLDAKLFKILDLNFDIYNRKRRDILVSPTGTVPVIIGATLPLLNQGKTTSKGFETSLGLNGGKTKKLNYFVSTNFSYFKNTIDFDAQGIQLNDGLVNAGALNGQPRRLKAIGFFTQDEINQRATNPSLFPAPIDGNVRAGDLKYQDVGGPNGIPDGIIDDNDLIAIGDPGIPRITVGLTTGLSFKNFDLNMVFQAVTNNSVYLGGSTFQAFQNNGQVSTIAIGRWTPENAETATYPRLSASNNLNNFRNSSFWNRDGSFIKLRSAELGYSLPSKISNSVRVNNARLFVQGTNIFSLDKVEYGDSEALTGYPVLKTFIVGARIGF